MHNNTSSVGAPQATMLLQGKKPANPAATLHHLLSGAIQVSDAYAPSSGNISLWLFGYGSLIWNPGFEYDGSAKARLDGYERVFYHGNKEHRGTRDMPGRVVTIEKNPATSVHGLAFRAAGLAQISGALKHLHYREIENGYTYDIVNIQLQDGQSVVALTVVADHESEDYVGPNDVDAIAQQIAHAKGRAGYNFEYLYKLADYCRQLFPEINDGHLYQLENAVRQLRKDLVQQIAVS